MIPDIIEESSLRSPLTEKSYSEHDIPPYFYLVTNIGWKPREPFEDPRVDQFIRQELKGVRGISSNKMIRFLWTMQGMGKRNTLLQVPSSSLLELNKFSRIMYDNPDYLISNGAKAHARVIGAYSDLSLRVANALEKYTQLGAYNFSNLGDEVLKTKPKNVRDFVRLYYKLANELDKYGHLRKSLSNLTFDKFENLVRSALINDVKKFTREQEWVLKGETMKIPDGSTLYVLGKNQNMLPGQIKERYAVIVLSATKLKDRLVSLDE